MSFVVMVRATDELKTHRKTALFFQECRCTGGSSHLMFESPTHVPTKPTNLKTRIAVLKVDRILILNLVFCTQINKKAWPLTLSSQTKLGLFSPIGTLLT